MNNQPSSRGSTVVPCLLYRDAIAMIDWLCNNIGFVKKAIHKDDDGTVAHSELTLGTGMIMVGSATLKDRETPWGKLTRQPEELGGVETQSPWLYVSDPGAVYARVKASGGKVARDRGQKLWRPRLFVSRPRGSPLVDRQLRPLGGKLIGGGSDRSLPP